jgi:ABC-type transport system involved in cytochrome c biogenesis permease component
MRRPSIWAVVAQVILLLIVGAFYIFLMWSAWTDPSSRDAIYGFVIFALLFFVVLGSALTGASGFAREKENGTWEALRLSSLAPDEILWGKVWAFLTATFIYILPLVPLLLASMDRNHSMNSAGPLQVLGSFILIGITGLLYHLFGLWISWGFRRTNPAVGWTLCAVTAFLVIWPIACGVSNMSGLVSGTHPFVALMAVNWGMGYPGSNNGQGILFDVLALIASVFLWGTLSNRMSNRKFDGL